MVSLKICLFFIVAAISVAYCQPYQIVVHREIDPMVSLNTCFLLFHWQLWPDISSFTSGTMKAYFEIHKIIFEEIRIERRIYSPEHSFFLPTKWIEKLIFFFQFYIFRKFRETSEIIRTPQLSSGWADFKNSVLHLLS